MVTTLQILEEVRTLVMPVNETAEQRADFDYKVELLIPSALTLMAVRICNDPAVGEKRELLRRQFTIDIVGGAGDLHPILTGDDRLLLPSLKRANIFVGGFDTPLEWLPERGDLALSRSPVFGYFAVEGESFYCVNVDDGGLDFTADFVPTLGNLADQLVPDLAVTLVEMLMGARTK